MKKILFILPLLLLSISASADNAQDARKVLDKVSAVVGYKGGAQANFVLSSGNVKNQSGTIAIKGSKFCATTAGAKIWYNGKTMWTYIEKNNEVNVATPNAAKQQQMNPYSFLNLYKNGYSLSMKSEGNLRQIHMLKKGAQISEIYVTVDSKNIPMKVRMLQGTKWTTITISNFKTKNLSDKEFTFNAKDYPKAEVVDLR